MKIRTIPVAIQLDESAVAKATSAVPAKVEIMRTGIFFRDGEEFEITSDMLKNMVKNFSDKVRGIDLAIDYKHDSENIAAGWVKNLELQNNDQELWGEIEWTPKGRQVLADKEFRYISGDFHTNWEHNETKVKYGPTLFGAGLTNRPFIKGMEPIVNLSEHKKGTIVMDEKDKKIAELTAALEAAKKSSSPAPAAGGDNASGGQELADMKKKLDEALAENEALKKEKQAYSDQQKLAEKKSKFDKLLTEGKAVEAQRESFMSDDLIKFSDLAAKPNMTGFGNTGTQGGSSTGKDVQDQVMELAEKLSKENKITLSDALKKVLYDNADLRKQYEDTQFSMKK